MFILYGTKADATLVPVAVFDTAEQLAAYVNALARPGATGLDPDHQAKSLLAGYVECQSMTLDQIWATWPNWQDELVKAQSCPRNPACAA